MRLNDLLAAPSFPAWLGGNSLDIDRMFFPAEGNPRVSLFSLAPLNDTERMFFVSLLLANPPSKDPLLTLLKQARTYGLGIVPARWP